MQAVPGSLISYCYYIIFPEERKMEMATAKKLPSGSWHIQVYCGKDKNGKKIIKSFTAPTKRAVELAAAEYAVHQKDPLQVSVTVYDAIETYITGRTGVLSPSTIRGYRMQQKHAFDLIGSLRLCDLSSQIVQEYISRIAKDYSPKSVKNIYSLFLAAVTYVDPSLHFHVVLPAKPQREVTVPTDEEVQRLIDAAPRDLKVAICLAAFGTLRAGEVCAVTYRDLNRKECFLHIHRDVVRDEYGLWVTKETPKNEGSNRYVELPQKLIDLIGDGKPDDRIVPLVPHSLATGFTRLRNRVGVNIRFHDLRHYSASIMHAIGIPDQYIMDRGGWKTDSTLKSVYRNVLKDKKNDFTDKTNQYFSETFRIEA